MPDSYPLTCPAREALPVVTLSVAEEMQGSQGECGGTNTYEDRTSLDGLYPVNNDGGGGDGEITETRLKFSYFLYENKCCCCCYYQTVNQNNKKYIA